MSSESKPLLSTNSTRQNYLAFSETQDPFYHKPAEPSSLSSSIHRSSSCPPPLCKPQPEEEDDETEELIQSGGRRVSRDSTTETLHENENDSNGSNSSKRQPTDSIAYIQRLEKVFGLFSTSLYLENSVSVARDHLANERTYLAWVRTSLSTISIGVAITQLFRLDKEKVLDPLLGDDLARIGRPLGISFIVIGMLYLVSAFIRYFHSQVAMTKGYFPASRGIVIFTSTATLAALLAVFVVIVKNQ